MSTRFPLTEKVGELNMAEHVQEFYWCQGKIASIVSLCNWWCNIVSSRTCDEMSYVIRIGFLLFTVKPITLAALHFASLVY